MSIAASRLVEHDRVRQDVISRLRALLIEREHQLATEEETMPTDNEVASDYPWCGATVAYVRKIPNGGTILHPPIVFFTDTIIFITPSKAQQGGRLVTALAGAALGLHAVEAIGEMQGRSKERQADEFNRLLRSMIESSDVTKLTSADVIAEFGAYTETWPNSRVKRATLRKKGWLVKSLHVRLTPQSGLSRGLDGPVEFDAPLKEVLKKAFGPRFHDET